LKDSSPRETSVYHLADIPGLNTPNVVKLKDERIGLPAVHARMCRKM